MTIIKLNTQNFFLEQFDDITKAYFNTKKEIDKFYNKNLDFDEATEMIDDTINKLFDLNQSVNQQIFDLINLKNTPKKIDYAKEYSTYYKEYLQNLQQQNKGKISEYINL